jgi:hypothetical protein
MLHPVVVPGVARSRTVHTVEAGIWTCSSGSGLNRYPAVFGKLNGTSWVYVPPESADELTPDRASPPAGAVFPVNPEAGPPAGRMLSGVLEVIVRVPAVYRVEFSPRISAKVVDPL